MSREQFIEQVVFKRARLPSKPKLNPNKQVPKWLYPFNIEIAYKKLLLQHVSTLSERIHGLIIPYLKDLVAQRNTVIKNDGWADETKRLLLLIQQTTGEPTDNMVSQIHTLSTQTSVWNNNQWQKILRSTFGVETYQREPWMEESLTSWINENTALIKKMSDDYIGNIASSVQRGIRQGDTHGKIAKDIFDRTKITKKKAKLIARDQTSKLNGNLTELRQTSIGIDNYKWMDSDDIRVRPKHKVNNGKIFSWAKPPVNTGHPSYDVQCRCWAEPDFSDLMNEVQVIENRANVPIEAVQTTQQTIIKSYKTKASAQSQRSRQFKGADIKYNNRTGKWELHIKQGQQVIPSRPPIIPPKPKPKPKPKSVTPEVKPFSEKQEIIIKHYKTKASAQSQRSRKYKGSDIKFNKRTGKWELHIKTGKTLSPPKPKIGPDKGYGREIPVPKSKDIHTRIRKPFLYSDDEPIVSEGKRPSLVDENGKLRPLSEIHRDIQKTGLLPIQTEHVLQRYEDKIRFNKFESGMTMDAHGLAPGRNQSQRHPTSVMMRGRSRNGVCTHNHPGGTTLSSNDVFGAIELNEIQMRATSEKYRYVLTRTQDTWLSNYEIQKYYNGNIENFLKEHESDIQKAFKLARKSAQLKIKEKNILAHSDLGKYFHKKATEDELLNVTKKYVERHNWHFRRYDIEADKKTLK